MLSSADLQGKTVLFTDKAGYARKRVQALALGVESATEKMMANVSFIIYGGERPPDKVAAKYPRGAYVREADFQALVDAQLGGVPQLLASLEAQGFRMRNPSDEADAQLEVFDIEPATADLSNAVLDYLRGSAFIARYLRPPYGTPPEAPAAGFAPLTVAASGLTWWYAFDTTAIDHVGLERGEGDYPQRIKGWDLWEALSAHWKAGTAARLYETPDPDSIAGLFILGGIDKHSGRLTGFALTRTWT